MRNQQTDSRMLGRPAFLQAGKMIRAAIVPMQQQELRVSGAVGRICRNGLVALIAVLYSLRNSGLLEPRGDWLRRP